MARRPVLLWILICFFLSTAPLFAKKVPLTFNSDPPGARVELNGLPRGTTPLTLQIDDSVFSPGGRWIWTNYLNEPITVTFSKEGYVSKSILITNGPYQWRDANGIVRKICYVITARSFDVKLEKIGDFLGQNPFRAVPTSNAVESTKLTSEQIVQLTLPAVVTVRSSLGVGSGFFIIETGVLVTNKHVVEGVEAVSIVTSKGEEFGSEAIFAHPSRDLALVKIAADRTFPIIEIADPASVAVGADVIAIGSPGVAGVALTNSVTKGIVSSFRQSDELGTLVQTDAAINAGNSGGPLLDSYGKAIGINTLKVAAAGKEGLGFAVYCNELLEMLKTQFKWEPKRTTADNHPQQDSRIMVQFSSDPSGAEIFVDGTFLGSTPSRLPLSEGNHEIKIVKPGFQTYQRSIRLEKGSEISIAAVLEKVLEIEATTCAWYR